MIMVTGANGLVGSAALKHLTRLGYEACGLVRAGSDLRRIAEGDICLKLADLRDPDSVIESMGGCTTVISCAALSRDWGSHRDFWSVNVDGVKNLIEAASRTGTVERVVHISTTNVAGYGGRDLVESDRTGARPAFIYSQSKLEGERVVADLCRQHGLRLVILRPSAVYGPGDWKWSYEMIDRIVNSRWPLISGGRAVFTPVFIENLCRSIELAIGYEGNDGIFNITDGVTVTWLEFAGKFAAAAGVEPRYIDFPYAIAMSLAYASHVLKKIRIPPGEPLITLYRMMRASKDFHYSCAHAMEELGYRPDSGIDRHVEKTVEWYREVTS